MRPRVEVRLERRLAESETAVVLLDTRLGLGRDAFRRLDTRLSRIYTANPGLRARIDPGEHVPHADVVRTLDSFLLAGADNVEFWGRRLPERGR